MTSEELIQAWRTWGKSMGGMVRVRKSTLQKTNLPEEAKQFLYQAGLPEMIGYSITKPTLPRLTELVSETGPLPASFARYRVIADVGYCMFLSLDEEENGQVVVVIADAERENEVFFYHSSILHYAECCVIDDTSWEVEIEQRQTSFPFPALDNYIASYEQAVREIDPLSLADDTWDARQRRNMRAEYGLSDTPG